jgi:pyrimidine operon attenuation protein/uracil phosphoribosyltransferase
MGKLILDNDKISLTIKRLALEIAENALAEVPLVLVGLQPRGALLAMCLHDALCKETHLHPELGYLDITFYRDDFRRRAEPLKPNQTLIKDNVEGKHVVLVDDVLYTARTLRAAFDALIAFGRPQKVETCVLVDRLFSREFPIEASYTGVKVNTFSDQRVFVDWKDGESASRAVYLINL